MEEVPFEDRYVPKAEIDWERSLWWWYPLSRAIHPALRITALSTSALAVAVLWSGLNLAEWLFRPRFVDGARFDAISWIGNIRLAPIEVGQSVLLRSLGLSELAYLTFCLLWITAVVGFFGGILTRRAAIELGRRTIAPWGETLRIVGSRMISYLWVTGMQLVAVAILLTVPFLLGVLARLGPMAWLSGVLLILLFPLVFAIGRLALSLFICYPLAVAAISCEKNADAFEGFSRSNNYFFQRPVLTVLCGLFLAGVGMIGHTIVFWWLMAGWHWMRDAFLSGAGYNVADLLGASGNALAIKPDEPGAVQAMRISTWVLIGGSLTRFLIFSYWFSFLSSATAALYLVLRRSVDNTELDDIDTPASGPLLDLPELPNAPAVSTASPDSV